MNHISIKWFGFGKAYYGAAKFKVVFKLKNKKFEERFLSLTLPARLLFGNVKMLYKNPSKIIEDRICSIVI